MANNRVPVFPKTPSLQSKAGAVIGPSANTSLDGTGSNIYEVFQAKDTSGTGTDSDSKVFFLRAKAVGSPAATVLRVFIYNGSSGTFTPGTSNTASNTFLVTELSLPAITASSTAASPDFTIPVNLELPTGNRILVTFGTSTGASGTGYVVSAFGGTY